jgi:hypothetical protein
MPKFVAVSNAPIRVFDRSDLPDLPDLPDFERPGIGGGPVLPERPEIPTLPPREEWPALPPDWRDHLPVLPDWGHPSIPLPPTDPTEPPVLPPGVTWPPDLPELPDISGKTLCLARIYVSRHVNVLRWIVLDSEAAKAAFKAAAEKLKGRLPAGGIAGRPPARPQPGQ